MSKLIHNKYALMCGTCLSMIYLPGIVPDEAMLKKTKWQYCPMCGATIEYSDQLNEGAEPDDAE